MWIGISISHFAYFWLSDSLNQAAKKGTILDWMVCMDSFITDLVQEKNNKLDSQPVMYANQSAQETGPFEHCLSEEDLQYCCDQFLANFCDRVIEISETQQITATQLAQISGIDRSALSRILRLKRKPSIETVIKLACILDISLSIHDLIDFVDEPKSK